MIVVDEPKPIHGFPKRLKAITDLIYLFKKLVNISKKYHRKQYVRDRVMHSSVAFKNINKPWNRLWSIAAGFDQQLVNQLIAKF